MDKLTLPDQDLVYAFCLREAHDFSQINVPTRALYDLVLYEINKYPNAINFKIRSHGNSGCVVRELSIDAKNWPKDSKDWQDVIINLCTCGKIDHMVHSVIAVKE